MRYIIIIIVFGFGVNVFFAAAPKKAAPVNTVTTPLAFVVPPHFPQPKYNFAGNALTQEAFALGKKIFYDVSLSSNGQVSCASCHQQFAGFVMYNHNLAHGVDDKHTTRNPQPLINLAWSTDMLWDGAANNLEVQPLGPLTASNEMNLSLAETIAKLNASPTYKRMFAAAYGDKMITSQRMLKAIAQYLVMLVSANSKYDKVQQGHAKFNPLENLGYAVFKNKCTSCHAEPLFTDLTYRNIGLPVDTFLNDYGRMRVTLQASDSLKFKVPTLRNITLTMPYMHDGRMNSLDEVIDHYRFNVVKSNTVDSIVKNRISISQTEQAALVAFMQTLTDTSFTRNPLYSPANN